MQGQWGNVEFERSVVVDTEVEVFEDIWKMHRL